MLVELDKPHPTNTLAGLISLAISTAIGTGYVVLSGLQFTQQLAVYLVALVFMSWLCAMVGYDKVVQTMTQMKSK
ncbi:MAG: aminopeptidase [Bacillota bacterium]